MCKSTDSSSDSQARWDDFFYGMARYAAGKSKDRRTKCGAVIVDDRQSVLSIGWNGFPRGVDDEPLYRHDRPAKYDWTEHAERNAIFNAASRGIPLLGSTIYVTGMPCCDCARAIKQAGIRCVVTIEPDWDDPHLKATQRLHVSKQLLAEGGERHAVLVRFIGGSISEPPEQLEFFPRHEQSSLANM